MKGVFVITQYFHIPRSKLALSKFGITPIYVYVFPHFGRGPTKFRCHKSFLFQTTISVLCTVPNVTIRPVCSARASLIVTRIPFSVKEGDHQ